MHMVKGGGKGGCVLVCAPGSQRLSSLRLCSSRLLCKVTPWLPAPSLAPDEPALDPAPPAEPCIRPLPAIPVASAAPLVLEAPWPAMPDCSSPVVAPVVPAAMDPPLVPAVVSPAVAAGEVLPQATWPLSATMASTPANLTIAKACWVPQCRCSTSTQGCG